ncbi:cell division protein FtsQ [Sphingobium quisquiliarum P25]|uniref:Cell division protein FtsQ n=1 Tax=Sphingobium quisquiliarum P25 TaxID=1329909 RepID=T0IUM3_9SPHN|nr:MULTISPECIES: cell division protein FtsQ/DivIB [Sphingobium]EQB15555.1 cell division protein FtsQ [Sphingobium quisquiliarum P25]EZP72680.1 Cell division protein FtsQ [Sphingomonas paucimobilis]
MAEARIRRGGTARLTRTASMGGRNGGGRGKPGKRRSWAGRMVHALPVSEDTLQRMASWAIVGIVVAAIAGIAVLSGVPAMAGQKAAEIAANAGFEVQKVEVRGVERMDELPVYNIALGQVDRSMLSLDLPKVRAEMMRLGWVKDARISRRLPDTLVVDIVERDPVAVWQHDGQLHLIDVQGVVLQSVSPSAMPDLPLVVGPSANRQTAGLNKLMENAPALKPMLAGATWVGNRRWDLRFQSGETLSLPEGDRASATALVNFARMDGVNRLLGRGIVKFDMRDPDRFVLRLPQDQAREKPAAQGAAKADADPEPIGEEG